MNTTSNNGNGNNGPGGWREIPLYGSLQVGVATHTWEARTILRYASGITEQIKIPFPFKCIIVGMRPSLTALGGSGVAPTTEDIDVSLDINTGNFITNASGQSTVAGDRDGSYVTLAAMGINARLLMLTMDGDNPQMAITFRSPRGPSVYQDTLTKLTLFARILKPTPRQ